MAASESGATTAGGGGNGERRPAVRPEEDVMDLRKKLLDMAQEATGDPGIAAVGDFQPRG